ncbi:hypothetical protein MRX96_007406 [Rhipicephalus microplus]
MVQAAHLGSVSGAVVKKGCCGAGLAVQKGLHQTHRTPRYDHHDNMDGRYFTCTIGHTGSPRYQSLQCGWLTLTSLLSNLAPVPLLSFGSGTRLTDAVASQRFEAQRRFAK